MINLLDSCYIFQGDSSMGSYKDRRKDIYHDTVVAKSWSPFRCPPLEKKSEIDEIILWNLTINRNQ